jgi:2,3-dihydroxybenzoate-AMP ligase
MSIEFTPWPDDLAAKYREKGYWAGRPLTDILQLQASGRPDDIAIICGDRLVSYADLNIRSNRLAYTLHHMGVRAHDTALVQLPNIAEFYIVFFALLKIGAVPINALFSHQRYELGHYADLVQPILLIGARSHTLFTDDSFSDDLRGACPSLRHILLLGSENERDLTACWTGDWHDSNAMDVVGSPTERLPAGIGPTAPDEVAFFQLSGGSTGTPKLIPRTHDDYFYSVRASAGICALTPQTRYLCGLPAGHNYPLSSPGALGIFFTGGTVVMAPNPEPDRCFDLIKKHRVTMAALVPSALLMWLETAKIRKEALRTLALVQVGGAMLTETVARRVTPELGCRLQQVFGMAEGLVSYTRLDDDNETICTTQGRPISQDDEIRIVDEAGIPVERGTAGLLTTRGPYTFRGYYRSPDHNALTFDADGFYSSGDVVLQRPDGSLQVVGRVKDQINRGGEKIAAEEIERLLIRHRNVVDAAVVALPNPHLGEKSCAFIMLNDTTIRPVAIRRHLREQGIADYKLPDRVEIVTTMPLTPIGKIDKKALRAWDFAASPQTLPLTNSVRIPT